MRGRLAKVAVSAASFAIDKPYDYLVPVPLGPVLRAGMRVTLPFGRGNRRSEGIVLSVYDGEVSEGVKPIASVLDAEPALGEEHIKLAIWMRERCFCPLYQAARAMLPAGLWYRLRQVYSVKRGMDRASACELAGKSKRSVQILDVLFARGGHADEAELLAAFPDADISVQLRRLRDAGVVEVETQELRSVQDKTQSIAALTVPPEEAAAAAMAKGRRAPAQAELLRVLADFESISVKELCYFTGASAVSVKALERQGLIEITQEEVYRRPELNARDIDTNIILNASQKLAYDGLITLALEDGARAALLYGVTGSGKTAVYIELIKRLVERGKTAMVLVPEIALTPQLTATFAAHFGGAVAVLHSSLRATERYDEWKRIKNGEVSVVVGTRSAVFAPLENIGVIILDEEQETTYKSENTPRYHARDVAKYRCVYHKALLLLGSATPSVESYHSAQTGSYSLFTLDTRFNERPLPSVMVADMRGELREGNTGDISGTLRAEIEKNIIAGEQSILFINRRGNSKLVTCGECGGVRYCERCSVPLTYHSVNNRLMCHYCGHSERVGDACPECGGALSFSGSGTQRVEEELNGLFPGVQIMRMDTDAVSPTSTHEMLLDKFERERVSILIGTQMVTKGLNFENVTLVGVLSADQSIYASDYRAYERSFSLMAQVIGRAGRGGKNGRAVIQTFTPGNEVIQLAASQDYAAFYRREIALREIKRCPPFAELFVIGAAGPDEAAVLRLCVKVRNTLKCYFGDGGDYIVLGPAPASVSKVNNRYRYRVTLSAPNTAKVRESIAHLMRSVAADRKNRGISIFADVNPLD